MNLVSAIESARSTAKLIYQFHPNSYSHQMLMDVIAIEREVTKVIGPLPDQNPPRMTPKRTGFDAKANMVRASRQRLR
jgi:hypothetical protein